LNHLHHQLALSFRDPYGALNKTGSDGFGSEIGATLSFLRFKISKASNRLASDIDADVLCCPVRVAHQCSNAASVENAIKITARSARSERSEWSNQTPDRAPPC
jgi:hypothetical protein